MAIRVLSRVGSSQLRRAIIGLRWDDFERVAHVVGARREAWSGWNVEGGSQARSLCGDEVRLPNPRLIKLAPEAWLLTASLDTAFSPGRARAGHDTRFSSLALAQLNRFQLMFDRRFEIAGLGVRSRKRADRAGRFPLSQLARTCRRLDRLLAIAELRRRARREQPRAGVVRRRILGIDADSFAEISECLPVPSLCYPIAGSVTACGNPARKRMDFNLRSVGPIGPRVELPSRPPLMVALSTVMVVLPIFGRSGPPVLTTGNHSSGHAHA